LNWFTGGASGEQGCLSETLLRLLSLRCSKRRREGGEKGVGIEEKKRGVALQKPRKGFEGGGAGTKTDSEKGVLSFL